MPFALSFKLRVHLLHFGGVKQEALRQYSFTDSAPIVTTAVNNRIAGGTAFAARPHSDPAQQKLVAKENRKRLVSADFGSTAMSILKHS